MAQMAQTEMGNTIPFPTPINIENSVNSTKNNTKKCRKYVFTINNWSKEELDTITQTLSNKNYRYIIGKEIGENKTPHLQGYLEANNAISFNVIKKIMPRAHIETAKGSTEQNFKYCSKDNDFITNIRPGDLPGLAQHEIDYKNYIEKKYKNVIWKEWQQNILNIINTEPNDRSIHWIYDKEGNKGKSFLTTYLDFYEKTIITNGKASDVFNCVKNYLDTEKISPKIIILDVPRSNLEYISYLAIEKMKDGLFYSGKYEGGRIRLIPFHLFIFANEKPIESKLTKDRIELINISDNE